MNMSAITVLKKSGPTLSSRVLQAKFPKQCLKMTVIYIVFLMSKVTSSHFYVSWSDLEKF